MQQAGSVKLRPLRTVVIADGDAARAGGGQRTGQTKKIRDQGAGGERSAVLARNGWIASSGGRNLLRDSRAERVAGMVRRRTRRGAVPAAV